MSWVTIIWSMVASACLTLAGMHLLVWCRKRTARANLLFALTAMATAALAACELWMMRAETTGEFGTALRWVHVPAWAVIVSLVGFVRLYLRAGRPWLAWAVCGMRTLSLVLNFALTPNLNYREITGLRHIRFLGESVSVAEGVPNPWMLVGQASLLLLVVFVVDATITVWRRGDRRQARLLGGAIVFFVAGGHGTDRAGALGNHRHADHDQPVLPGHRRGDGLRNERRRAPRRAVVGRAARERRADVPGRRGGGVWHLDVEHRAQPGLGLGEVAPPVRVRTRCGRHI